MNRTRTIYQLQNASRRCSAIALLIVGLTLISSIFACDAAWSAEDHFACFDATQCGNRSLSSSALCLKNRDYTITTAPRDSEVIALSIHGGEIEPMTSEITQTLADHYNWSRYDFKAHGTAECLEERGNFDTLHITATQFDDPVALALVNRHSKAIAIHGARNLPRETICVGGGKPSQIQAFINFINRNRDNSPYSINANFGDGKCAGLKGEKPFNIVNRTASHAGLQLELSRQMREDLVKQTPEAERLRHILYDAIATALTSTDPIK